MEFERRNAMTLEEFLRKIDHKKYSVFYQDANLPVEMQKLTISGKNIIN